MPPCGHIRMQDADGWVTLGCLYHFLYYKFDLKSYQARLFFRLCLELHLRSPIKKKKRNCNTCKEWEPVIFVHYKVAGNRPKCDFSFSSIQFNLYSVNFKYLYKYHSILLALWMWQISMEMTTATIKWWTQIFPYFGWASWSFQNIVTQHYVRVRP